MDCRHRRSKESLGVDSPGYVCNHPFTDDDGDFEDCDHIGEEAKCPMFEPVAPSPAWGSSYHGPSCRFLGSLFIDDGWQDYWLAPSMLPAKWSILIRYGTGTQEVVYYCDRPENRVRPGTAGFYVAAEALWRSEKARMNKPKEVLPDDQV